VIIFYYQTKTLQISYFMTKTLLVKIIGTPLYKQLCFDTKD